ncbi:Histidine kinase [Rubrivivax sp. A210]|uniref:sensor histidine kinase n=1 Tax=Rubrivivax sp. A210 TaxID=2772301 RepID=UPI00191A8D4C|nr:sensor histidine kinase [Rubrivivax sp. A210]CAD5374114.1 Histidine kinase [Rubrivivax sp. A210]
MSALSAPLVLAVSLLYLLALFGVAWWADRRALAGRSVIGNAWVYALSMCVYCTAWTYFGSVGRAASGGVWFLPIYLGPTLAMVLGWLVLRKMVRIARTWRITSIADFVASRYGKSRLLAGLVTLIALVGVVPYVALQLKAVASGIELLTGGVPAAGRGGVDTTLIIALVLAGFTIAFGTRHLDNTERHEGLVAAIAAESVVKLLAFLAVGGFVTWGLFDGPGDLFAQAMARPEIARVLQPDPARPFAYDQWFALMLLAMFSIILLPRQFQVMVVENVDEQHIRRAAWSFPAYLLLINLFVLPIAFGGLLYFGGSASPAANPETFVLALPLAAGHPGLALVAFVGGLSAATGMVIVEAIAVSTMVCNDLVLPGLLRLKSFAERDLTGTLLAIRRTVILGLLLLGWLYFRIAGEAYALVSIGLISFAAVAQFAPALLGGMYWKGGTRNGALAGLLAGALLWTYTLMLPSIAKSGWMDAGFLQQGLFGWALLKPEALFGLVGMDNLTHALFWSLLANAGLYVGVSLARPPQAAEASQALRFVDVYEQSAQERVFWRGRAHVDELIELVGRFLGPVRTRTLFDEQARALGGGPLQPLAQADPRLVQYAETLLAGAIGSASARVMISSVVEEETLELADVMRIVEEASELRHLNEQLKSLDRLKDDFMSSVTHELRTPLTSIRALSELMRDEPEMEVEQRQQFLTLVVAEAERLSRLVNQVLDMAKIESGHADWLSADVDLALLLRQAVQTTSELFRERGARVELLCEPGLPTLRADPDRLLQVVINLLSNAAKFVPQGEGRVEVKLARQNGGVTVTVHDNGPGVPAAQQALVFEKFRQGGDASNRPQGTGLGLPISRRIVEHFGGRLWLRSEPGQGSCFGFDLPLPQEEETKT